MAHLCLRCSHIVRRSGLSDLFGDHLKPLSFHDSFSENLYSQLDRFTVTQHVKNLKERKKKFLGQNYRINSCNAYLTSLFLFL